MIPFVVMVTFVLTIYVVMKWRSVDGDPARIFPFMWFIWGALLIGYMSVTMVLKAKKHKDLKNRFHILVEVLPQSGTARALDHELVSAFYSQFYALKMQQGWVSYNLNYLCYNDVMALLGRPFQPVQLPRLARWCAPLFSFPTGAMDRHYHDHRDPHILPHTT